MGDSDTRKEMEAQLQMPKPETPDLAEMMTNFFKGGSGGSNGQSSADARRSVRGGASGLTRGVRRRDK